jgi:hypothetical protein
MSSLYRPLDLLLPVLGPECPEREVRPIRCRKQSEPRCRDVRDTVPYLRLAQKGILGEPGSLGYAS